jgi:hypothetical protein
MKDRILGRKRDLVRERLRCRSRHIVVTFLGPHQRSGDLPRLFDLPVS